MTKTFRELALSALEKGLHVTRLKPGDKRPLSENWLAEATDSKMVCESWSAENPRCGCGAVVKREFNYWVVDIDQLDWFMDSCPFESLPTGAYTVETGGGGRHFYFLGIAPFDGNKHRKNPDLDRYRKYDGSECKSVMDVLVEGAQVLVAGNVHPKTGRAYSAMNEAPIAECPPAFLAWLKSELTPKAEKKKASAATAQVEGKRSHDNAFEVDGDWNPHTELKKAGLKYDVKTRDGIDYFNYHVMMGKCLVKGALHEGDGGGNRNNNECSAFAYKTSNRQLWHKCQAGGCCPDQGREFIDLALKELGLDPQAVFYKEGRRGGRLVKASTVTPEHLTWLWPGYLPTNKLIHFAGVSSAGKSPVTVDVSARVSGGKAWPGGVENVTGPRSVIMLAAEDSRADVVVPRLQLAGADMDRVFFYETTVNKDMNKIEQLTALDQDINAIMEMARVQGDVGLIVIDPITNYLGKVRMNHEEEVRTILMPLSFWAQELGLCIITVGHLNKRNDAGNAQQRVMGANAFVGVARGTFFFEADPEDPSEHSHVMIPTRIVAKAQRYATVAMPWEFGGEFTDHVGIEWRGESEATQDDVGKMPTSKEKSEVKQAAEFLHDFLKQGQRSSVECLDALRQNGWRMQADGGKVNENRVRKLAGAITSREGKAGWMWRLRASGAEAAQDRSQQDISFDAEDM